MTTVRTVATLRTHVRDWQAAGRHVALVPTMGALHAGHLALVAAALAHADRVVASIFINPSQFGPHEDFSRYPRQEAEDAAALSAAGCHLLYAPDAAEMYPADFATEVHVAELSEGLCGTYRPGHFGGVATVVTKLLNQAAADIALFGEKDYQQLLIIRRLARDLDIPTAIVGVPTVREADGLALSSRNAYLTPDERRAAGLFPQALNAAKAGIEAGKPPAAAIAAAHAALTAASLIPDYIELRDAETLVPVTTLDRTARLLAAVRIGKTRLIDNLAVG